MQRRCNAATQVGENEIATLRFVVLASVAEAIVTIRSAQLDLRLIERSGLSHADMLSALPRAPGREVS